MNNTSHNDLPDAYFNADGTLKDGVTIIWDSETYTPPAPIIEHGEYTTGEHFTHILYHPEYLRVTGAQKIFPVLNSNLRAGLSVRPDGTLKVTIIDGLPADA